MSTYNKYAYKEGIRSTARKNLKGISLDCFNEYARLIDIQELELANDIRIDAKDEGLYLAVSFMNQYNDND